MDLSPLRNEITFGTNRIYLLFDKLGFETTYYVAADRMFIRQFAKEIAALRPPKFLNWQASDSCAFTDGTAFWNSRSYLGVERFSSRIDREIVEGHSVTYACMQIARYMGFNEVVLIGVDHHYRNAVDTNAAYSPLRGPDLDHFDPAYFTNNQLIGRPDLKGAEAVYRLARTVYAREGRRIVDATVSGKLDVFPKIDYSRCFTDKLS